MSKDNAQAAARRGSFFQTLKAVSWGFFGVRKRASFEMEAQKLNPIHIITVGVFLAVVFIVVLLMVARWVAPGAAV